MRATLLLIGLGLAACEGTPGAGEPDVVVETVTCTLLSPGDGELIEGSIEVRVGFTGPVASVALEFGGVERATLAVADPAAGEATLTWDTTALGDADGALTARVVGLAGSTAASEPVTLVVDNLAPTAAFGVERFALLRGTAEVALDIDEAHVASIAVHDQFGELFAAEDTADGFDWDTTDAEDRIHRLALEVTDVAGHVAEVAEFPVVVVNHGGEVAVEYTPGAEAFVPANYTEVDYDTLASVPGRDGVYRLISWITWDASAEWRLAFSIGEGVCPHRGIPFIQEDSADGELALEMARDELPTYLAEMFPDEYAGLATFPYNGDPLTLGAFFAHVRPLYPEFHVGESLPIEIHYVLVDLPPAE